MNREKINLWRQTKWGQIIETILLAIIIVTPIRLFIAQPFLVSGPSMDPTFADGQYLIVDEISSYFRAPQRLDVLIFKPPVNEKKFYIKRLIGLPGETVTIKDDIVTIKNTEYPTGFVLAEPYVNTESPFPPLPIDHTWTLGPDEYFMLGDNRNQSSDSRVWGPISKKEIVGRPFLRLLPLSAINLWPGDKY